VGHTVTGPEGIKTFDTSEEAQAYIDYLNEKLRTRIAAEEAARRAKEADARAVFEANRKAIREAQEAREEARLEEQRVEARRLSAAERMAAGIPPSGPSLGFPGAIHSFDMHNASEATILLAGVIHGTEADLQDVAPLPYRHVRGTEEEVYKKEEKTRAEGGRKK